MKGTRPSSQMLMEKAIEIKDELVRLYTLALSLPPASEEIKATFETWRKEKEVYEAFLPSAKWIHNCIRRAGFKK